MILVSKASAVFIPTLENHPFFEAFVLDCAGINWQVYCIQITVSEAHDPSYKRVEETT